MDLYCRTQGVVFVIFLFAFFVLYVSNFPSWWITCQKQAAATQLVRVPNSFFLTQILLWYLWLCGKTFVDSNQKYLSPIWLFSWTMCWKSGRSPRRWLLKNLLSWREHTSFYLGGEHTSKTEIKTTQNINVTNKIFWESTHFFLQKQSYQFSILP